MEHISLPLIDLIVLNLGNWSVVLKLDCIICVKVKLTVLFVRSDQFYTQELY